MAKKKYPPGMMAEKTIRGAIEKPDQTAKPKDATR
jgi:hypothetical protein